MNKEVTSLELRKLIVEEMNLFIKENQDKIVARAEKRLKELKNKNV